MQKICVIARFDKELENKFMEWKKNAYALQKVYYADRHWKPHLTLAAYEDVNISDLCDWIGEYTNNKLSIPIQFSSLGVFPHSQLLDTDVIFLNPCDSKELIKFYYGFHEKFDDCCGDFGFKYSATYGNPVFHSTILISHKDYFNQTLDYLRNVFKEIDGSIVALEVYDVPMKLIKRYELI